MLLTRILIVGAFPFDSGKTHLAIQLGKTVIDSDLKASYFKPVSGHNYWYHYEHTKRCLEDRQLVSRDATLVREILGLTASPLLMNPIHSLFSPARVSKPLQNISNSLGLSGSTSVQTMQRFSRPLRGKIDTTVLIADELVESNKLIISQEEVGKLSQGASIVNANNLEAFQEYEQLHYEEYVSKSFSAITKQTDIVIIESFNDSVWPWEGLDLVDNVLVVSPGHVFNYDPQKIGKAALLMKRRNLPIREVTFGRVTDLLKPLSKIEVKPDSNLSSSQLKTLGIELPHRKE
jgi:predicted P-loop ATPase/GTPase